MERTTLGRTGIEVSAWCLGTMTYGNQTPEADAHRQIDMALDAGIDFLDCAEMYPVNPVTKETAGRSEEILGSWLEKTGRRGDVVLATKASGPGNAVRSESYSSANLEALVDGSLRRLKTDVIDLYQLHWPTRGTWAFRQNWTYDPSGRDARAVIDHLDDVLGALGRLIEAGKIRAIGLSNETAWGTTMWHRRAEATGGPRMETIQNEYSLMCRLMDTDLAETLCAEGVTSLAFSPLAAGILTGKYQDGAVPKGSRMDLNPEMGGRMTDRVGPAVAAYMDVAKRHGLDPVHMAMAWQTTRPFHNVPIFGATDTDQLQRILDGIGTRLDDEVLKAIDKVHKHWPLPYRRRPGAAFRAKFVHENRAIFASSGC